MTVHTITVRCPRCGENAVDVELYGPDPNDFDGIRCNFCGALPEADREQALNEAIECAIEYARRRHDY